MTRYILAAAGLFGIISILLGCGKGSSNTNCMEGMDGCPCFSDGTCAEGLECVEGLCHPTDSSSDTNPGASGDSDADGDADSDSDADADNDSDGDSDTDGDGDSDSDADSDSDSDADSDSDVDTDSDAIQETDREPDSDSLSSDRGTDSDSDMNVEDETDQAFNEGWRFIQNHKGAAPVASDFDDSTWEAVTLPHTAHEEPLVITGSQWQGECWYRKRFTFDSEAAGKTVFLLFEGAMNVADVWLDGEHLGQHLGGYLPFGFDITDAVSPGDEHVIAVKLNNEDNAVTGPKPIRQLDFNLFSGLYRDVYLVVKESLHITDPILADKPASGGIFFRTLEASKASGKVWMQAHVENSGNTERTFTVQFTLRDQGGNTTEVSSDPVTLSSKENTEVEQTLEMSNPALWSPRSPNLYTLETKVMEGDTVIDSERTRVGIRTISISAQGFSINGEKMFLRGTNRHQEHPYVGYAVPNAAQYRDAKRIKDAGFDYIWLSHYPHDPAFMDACDELGIVLMDCIPGWQYFGSAPAFSTLQYDNSRRLVRRDRNHPSVILWEVSLNETDMPSDFISTTHNIAHEEYPGKQCYTCGWRGSYDVFIEARQHGGCTSAFGTPCVVSEYGDWEYYAQNAGLNQDDWADLAPDESNSRQLRWHGEKALLQQATNFQEAHNDNLKTKAFADGLWVMYDYNRGYAPDIESSGCIDIMRLPKFFYYLFQSQRDPGESYVHSESGPMVFIASYWTASSDLDVRVFSNCDEVELFVNGTSVGRQGPDTNYMSSDIAHPPFTFSLGTFEPGILETVAYLNGAEAARHTIQTPGTVESIELWCCDEGGRPFAQAGKDTIFIHAALKDRDRTVVPNAWENVFFGVTGNAVLVGANPFSSDAGISSILLEADTARPGAAVYALATIQDGGSTRVLSAALPVDGAIKPFEVRVTTDGSKPTLNSPEYSAPLTADRVRAALFVNGEEIASADSQSKKFRIQGSTAP